MSDTSNASPQAESNISGMVGDTGVLATSDEIRRLDGNAAAGLLAEIFVLEMSSAQSTCAHCGRTWPLGALLLYGGQIGAILRCPSCDYVQLRIVRVPEHGGQPGQYCLDMRGMTLLRITRSTPM